MNKIVGLDIGENSVKMAYFVGRELKRTAKLELPDAMVSGGRILSMDAMADFLHDAAKGSGIPLTERRAGRARRARSTPASSPCPL